VKRHAKAKNYVVRKKPSLETRTTILIVCEGTKTEPGYFDGFRVAQICEIDAQGTGYNTLSLVNEAIRLSKLHNYNQVWCVFDKDDFPNSDFDNAIQKARQNKFEIAYSNQSFELWYVLHYQYLTSSLHRRDYCRLLDTCLGKKYEKNSKDMYEVLLPRQKIAIENSERLLTIHSTTPANSSPSTTVHLLVKELNRLASQRR
jgi:hypothetical protein